MQRSIQFWFEFASTYSYLSAMRIEDLAAQHGVSVEWHPFLLGPIFASQGWDNSPFNIYPAKGRYMWRDMERLTAQRGLRFSRPDPFPQNGLKAARLVMTIEAHPQRAAFVRAVYAAEFVDGLNIADDQVLIDCLSQASLPPDTLAHCHDTEIKAALMQQTQTAQAKGIFGAPSFLVGEELFWGDDRLDEAMQLAAEI
ncbi:2-hydroxychromene-2-carboxylate isomerase [Ruegeria denitrificans]|uniref:2-hydroxychromene-2-carboxylate isomerase n=1 Tax=Ruegeria denitrificans TaxID=1715692 RepID=A0A0P1IA86_9RHOB|nr:2-hydroxychromene-2-carboxylate isomerase [Ruegeria denitrificans]CUK01161.1 2-hydroxychromene-2-carboxylate isomerase [Ruegeria denitrificans]